VDRNTDHDLDVRRSLVEHNYAFRRQNGARDMHRETHHGVDSERDVRELRDVDRDHHTDLGRDMQRNVTRGSRPRHENDTDGRGSSTARERNETMSRHTTCGLGLAIPTATIVMTL